MKNIVSIIIIILVYAATLKAQTVSLENSFQTNQDGTIVSIQKIDLTVGRAKIKFDYKLNAPDILGIVIPELFKTNSLDINLMIVKMGDGGQEDKFALGIWSNKQFSNFGLMINIGRLANKQEVPWDFAGGMISHQRFTFEAYAMTLHSLIGNKWQSSDIIYVWAAYHPEKSFFSLGLNEGQVWAYAGTRNLKRFGNFTFANYDPRSGNFWFKSQSGFGEINQGFFSLETYRIAAEYLTVPLFFHKHFSPLCAKGDYAVKFEGRRLGGVHSYEAMLGKNLPSNDLGLAIGINSEYCSELKIAPSAELYKNWQWNGFKGVVELRYDMISNALVGYLVLKY
ncbi:hypothetical protein GW934_02210 [Candidatus Falkowbacteria bacterium]|nr:hypothetical protein [Candidatus Falkowbacteria bacterium]